MDAAAITLLALAIGAAATLYSSVGHGGASAYIALMALAGLAPAEIRPAALILNVVVAGWGAFVFVRAGRFDGAILWPFAIAAIPAAFIFGRIDVPESLYRPLLAAALGVAAIRYLFWPQLDATRAIRKPGWIVALPVGAALGALAGVTGIGGGVYLSPLLVFAGWSDPHRATGIAACFIVLNSLAGLAGRMSSLAALPPYLPWLIAAAAAGAVIGAGISVTRLSKASILRALGIILGLASIAVAS